MSFSLKDDVLKAVRDGGLGGYIPLASVRPSPPKTGSKVKAPCSYKTPCGWCSNWNKKCDNKIGCERPQRGLRAKMKVLDDASIYSAPCGDCDNYDKNSPECIKCGTANNFQNFKPERKRINND